jgi:hypothetical protein
LSRSGSGQGRFSGITDRGKDAITRISIEKDDLFNMPSILVSGVEDRSANYKIAESKTRILDNGTKETMWRGMLTANNRTGFASFLSSPSGALTGTFTTEVTSSELVQLPSGRREVRSTAWKDFLPHATVVFDSSKHLFKSRVPQGKVEVAGSFSPDHSDARISSGPGALVFKSRAHQDKVENVALQVHLESLCSSQEIPKERLGKGFQVHLER